MREEEGRKEERKMKGNVLNYLFVSELVDGYWVILNTNLNYDTICEFFFLCAETLSLRETDWEYIRPDEY